MNNQELYNEIRARKIVPNFTRIGNLYISSALANQIKDADLGLSIGLSNLKCTLSGKTFSNQFSVFFEWSPISKS